MTAKKTGQEDGLALEYASDELKTDQQVVLATVKQNGLALKFASDELKTDQQVVLEAVKQTGLAVKFASDHLRGYYWNSLDDIQKQEAREIVLEAVSQNGLALEYVDFSLRSDDEIVNLAINSHWKAWGYALGSVKINTLTEAFSKFAQLGGSLSDDQNSLMNMGRFY